MDPTQKQQITETMRTAENVIITVGKNPSIDDIAGAVALTQILTKLGKRADAVVSSKLPKSADFLATRLLSSSFNGIRDFIISVNTSHTEADKLKYVPEGKRLNIYITPYNGNFNEEDVDVRYGDYHVDAVIGLGVSGADQLDKAIASEKQLLEKSKLITITAGEGAGGSGLNWHEPNTSSVCELLMGLNETLQGSPPDDEIATALLTGILAKTEHFTNAATTPKVMTIAAQLMAAGAKQTEILAHLQETGAVKPGEKGGGKKSAAADQKDKGSLAPAQEQSLRHEPSKPKPPLKKVEPTPLPPPPPLPTKKAEEVPPGGPKARTIMPPPPEAPKPEPPISTPAAVVESLPPLPPRPASVTQVKPDSALNPLPPLTPGSVTAPASVPPLGQQTPVTAAPDVLSSPPPPASPPVSPFATTTTPPPGPIGSPPPASPASPAATPTGATEDLNKLSPPPPPHVDLDAARKAVEQATQSPTPPQAPPPPIPPAQ